MRGTLSRQGNNRTEREGMDRITGMKVKEESKGERMERKERKTRLLWLIYLNFRIQEDMSRSALVTGYWAGLWGASPTGTPQRQKKTGKKMREKKRRRKKWPARRNQKCTTHDVREEKRDQSFIFYSVVSAFGQIRKEEMRDHERKCEKVNGNPSIVGLACGSNLGS